MTIDPITLHRIAQQRLTEQRAAAATRRSVRRRPGRSGRRDADPPVPCELPSRGPQPLPRPRRA